MPIFKERKFQEEADIMALDTNENLYIFELKRWQAKEENLLQVLRYGQLFGNSSYEDLDNMYKSFTERNDISLVKNHSDYFGLEKPLDENVFNKEQNFIMVTNGMDQKTIEAIKYWINKGLKIDGLIYWIYQIEDKNYMEIDRYMPDKSLIDYETNSYILNTSYNNDVEAHTEMLTRNIAAAYTSGWKEK